MRLCKYSRIILLYIWKASGGKNKQRNVTKFSNLPIRLIFHTPFRPGQEMDPT